MKWRDPKVELPKRDQVVAILTFPHKSNEPITSRQIFFGECWDENKGYIMNNDSIGEGSRSWTLRPSGDDVYVYEDIEAWMPADEFVFPEFK